MYFQSASSAFRTSTIRSDNESLCALAVAEAKATRQRAQQKDWKQVNFRTGMR